MPIIEEILKEAKEAGASDVHLTVGLPPKMRVNGNLLTMDYPKMLPVDTLDILLNIMTESQRERFEENGENDMSFSIPGCGRFRVNAYKQRGTVALAFRLVGSNVPTPEELGVPESVIELYRKKRGLILVAGSAGSGKSTTLAAMVEKINSNRDAHIITLEDPIEFLHQHKQSMVNQREIGMDSQNYVAALRAAMREDPDVILVGELDNYETISVAIAAAETGHLVLSTLPTVDVVSTVERVIDVFPPHQQQQMRVQFANVVEAVVSQQLLPTKDGNSRVAAYEVMRANDVVRNLIRENKMEQLASIMQNNDAEGMITMDEAVYQLYRDGKISEEVAILFAQNPEAMESKIYF